MAPYTKRGRERVTPATNDWDWPITASNQKHNERVALLRQIPYELTAPIEPEPDVVRHGQGRALSVNISSSGMLLLMEQAPAVEQVLRVHVPTPSSLAETPTLAEVRWTRKVPFGRSNSNGMYFVGLKFMF
jgi:PilZ domain